VFRQVVVARLVAGACARAASAAAAECAWAAEVEMLRLRIERMGRMEEAMERRRQVCTVSVCLSDIERMQVDATWRAVLHPRQSLG
jgi:hypothetical protein